MKMLRGERQCLEDNMVRDRVLKMKCWVIYVDQERGVDLGNQNWEWNWGQHWEYK